MIGEIAKEILLFATSGLVIYFLQESIKVGRESKRASSDNGDSLKELHHNLTTDINNLRSEMRLITKHVDTAMTTIEAYNKSIDTVLSINSDRHGELMTRTEDIMREQRKVQNTVDLERSRLDSFSKAGITLADRVQKNVKQIKRMDDYLVSIRKKLNEAAKNEDDDK